MTFCTNTFRIYPETDTGLTTWTITFPYLNAGDVKCLVRQADGQEYLIPRSVSGSTVTLTTPPVDSLLTIYRDSNVVVPAVVFSDDEPIRIDDVHTMMTQLLYLSQELSDYIGEPYVM